MAYGPEQHAARRRLPGVITCPNCGTANPEGARFCMNCAQPLAPVEATREARKVVTQLQAKGESRIAFIPVDSLAMDGCNWHPSLADHAAIAEKLIRFIDDRKNSWN